MAEQRAAIPTLLAHGPAAYGFRRGVWTTARVADVTTRTFGIRYHPTPVVSRLLRSLGLSVHKSSGRATQRDDEAIAHWYREGRPALKKEGP